MPLCTVCGHEAPEFLPLGRRRNARCPGCHSVERHRFLHLLLDRLDMSGGVLDVAPQLRVRRKIVAGASRYVGLDLAPKRQVTVVGSLTELPFAAGSFGAAICYHVLEHIPDDRSAIHELARVLAPGGVAVVQVPVRHGRPTEEDPDAPEEERARRFGQANHVRFYGDDFDDRLREAGLEPTRILPDDLLTPEEMERQAINSRPVWWCVRQPTA